MKFDGYREIIWDGKVWCKRNYKNNKANYSEENFSIVIGIFGGDLVKYFYL